MSDWRDAEADFRTRTTPVGGRFARAAAQRSWLDLDVVRERGSTNSRARSRKVCVLRGGREGYKVTIRQPRDLELLVGVACVTWARSRRPRSRRLPWPPDDPPAVVKRLDGDGSRFRIGRFRYGYHYVLPGRRVEDVDVGQIADDLVEVAHIIAPSRNSVVA